MTIARQQVIDRVVAILNNKTAAASRVYPGRFRREDTYPNVRVVVDDDNMDDASFTGDAYDLELSLSIELRDKAVTGVERQNNELASHCLKLLLEDKSLGLGAKEIRYRSTSQELVEDQEKPASMLTVNFIVWVTVDADDHDVILE